jgi:hypothetical protein
MHWPLILFSVFLVLIVVGAVYVRELVDDTQDKYEKYEIKKSIEDVKNKEKK